MQTLAAENSWSEPFMTKFKSFINFYITFFIRIVFVWSGCTKIVTLDLSIFNLYLSSCWESLELVNIRFAHSNHVISISPGVERFKFSLASKNSASTHQQLTAFSTTLVWVSSCLTTSSATFSVYRNQTVAYNIYKTLRPYSSLLFTFPPVHSFFPFWQCRHSQFS